MLFVWVVACLLYVSWCVYIFHHTMLMPISNTKIYYLIQNVCYDCIIWYKTNCILRTIFNPSSTKGVFNNNVPGVPDSHFRTGEHPIPPLNSGEKPIPPINRRENPIPPKSAGKNYPLRGKCLFTKKFSKYLSIFRL